MTRTSVTLLSMALVSGATLGAAYLSGARESRAPVAETVTKLSPRDASPPTPALSIEESRRAVPQHERALVLDIERALVSLDPQQREAAFNVALPELLQSAPDRVTALVARQEPGEARDALRDEVARQWISRDRDAAIEWMNSFESDAERDASATIAMRTMAAIDPAQAIYIADQFGIGRDDGSLEHMVQIWAVENPEAASRWLAAQPETPGTQQLRARIESE